jgi:hypothetical protein
MDKKLRNLISLFRELGFDVPKFFNGVRGIPRFLKLLGKWVVVERGKVSRISPAFGDYRNHSGEAKGHYFWQDLICGKWIFQTSPVRHLDVGSRIDGFIAHLLTFREVDVLDIRELPVKIPGLTTVIGNAQEALTAHNMKYDSVSSLHSIEHFGLGRYGDPLDLEGHIKGLSNISECVQKGGILYVSFPVGLPRVEFNSQRILDPNLPILLLKNFTLEDFVLIPWNKVPIYGLNPSDIDLNESGNAGLYKFKRLN